MVERRPVVESLRAEPGAVPPDPVSLIPMLPEVTQLGAAHPAHVIAPQVVVHTRNNMPSMAGMVAMTGVQVSYLDGYVIPVMDLTIDTHAPEPSYVQLAAILRGAIETGEIAPREALPSITHMVQATGLAVGTVRKAVAVLVEERLAYIVPGRGTFVSGRPSE